MASRQHESRRALHAAQVAHETRGHDKQGLCGSCEEGLWRMCGGEEAGAQSDSTDWSWAIVGLGAHDRVLINKFITYL